MNLDKIIIAAFPLIFAISGCISAPPPPNCASSIASIVIHGSDEVILNSSGPPKQFYATVVLDSSTTGASNIVTPACMALMDKGLISKPIATAAILLPGGVTTNQQPFETFKLKCVEGKVYGVGSPMEENKSSNERRTKIFLKSINGIKSNKITVQCPNLVVTDG